MLHKIKFENRLKGDTLERCLATNDGTDFMINEPRPFNKGWHSEKHNGPGVKYELTVSIKTGDIAACCGPFRGGEHDISIFRHRLKKMLLPMEKVIADRGYRGDQKVVTPYDYDCINRQHKRAMGVLRARHETINRRLKTWGCLKQKWRHSLHQHHLVFRSAIAIAQLLHENGRPSFQVTGYRDQYWW